MPRSNTPPPDKPAKAPLSPEDRQMHISLALLSLAVMIDILGFSIIIPLVPEYVQRALHTAPTDPRIGEVGGWLTAVYALMQFVFAPLWGGLSDRIGRKPILIGSLVGDAVFYILFGLSVHSLWGLFAARILAGIFSSASLSVAQAYAADITPPHLRAMGLGYLGAAFGVGFVFGPALGGLIGQYNLAAPLYVSAALAIINLIYIQKKLPEPQRDTVAATGPPASFARRLQLMGRAVSGPVGFLYVLTFAVTFAFANLEGTFTTYLKQHFHYGTTNVAAVAGGVFAYIGILIVIIQGGAIRPLVKRFGEPNLIVVGIGLMALGFLTFPFAGHLLASSDWPHAADLHRQRPEQPVPARPGVAQVGARPRRGHRWACRPRLTAWPAPPARRPGGTYTSISGRPRRTGARGLSCPVLCFCRFPQRGHGRPAARPRHSYPHRCPHARCVRDTNKSRLPHVLGQAAFVPSQAIYSWLASGSIEDGGALANDGCAPLPGIAGSLRSWGERRTATRCPE